MARITYRESVKKSKDKINDFKLYKETCQNADEALKYLSVHKNCPYGTLEYGLALLRDNKLDEAKAVFEKLLDGQNNCYAITNLICIEFYLGNYEKCLEYLNLLEKYDNKYYTEGSFNLYKLFCMSCLNIPIDIDFANLDYIESVILNYSRESALNHIAYHKKDVYERKNNLPDFDEKASDERFFAQGVNIDELYDNIREFIRTDEVMMLHDPALTSDIYFRYDNVGSNVRGIQNYLRVMILTGTDRIISMFPVKKVDRGYLASRKPVFDYAEIFENNMDKEERAL